MEAIQLHVTSLRKDVSSSFQACSHISISCVSNCFFWVRIHMDCVRHSFMHACFLSLEDASIPKLVPLKFGRPKLTNRKIHLKDNQLIKLITTYNVFNFSQIMEKHPASSLLTSEESDQVITKMFLYSCLKQTHKNNRKSVHNPRHNRPYIGGKKGQI